MATLEFSENEEALNGGAQLAVVDNGEYYLIDLSSSAEDVAVSSAPVIFHKVESELVDEANGNGISFQYFSPNQHNSDGSQVYLDDEQALAVANLLEFHNQQGSRGVVVSSAVEDVGASYTPAEPFITTAELIIKTEKNEETLHAQDVKPPELFNLQLVTTDTSSSSLPEVSLEKTSVRKMYERKRPFSQIGDDVKTPIKASKLDAKASCDEKPVVNLVGKSKNPDKPSIRNSHLPLESAMRKIKKPFVLDSVRSIPPSEFKQQLLNTSDIVLSKAEHAPSTKKMMHYLQYEGVGKFFAYPGRNIASVSLSKLFFSRLHRIIDSKPTKLKNKSIPPLDSELRIPSEPGPLQRCTHSHNLSSKPLNEVAKRTASSFDLFCKGMNRPHGSQYRGRKQKLAISAVKSGVRCTSSKINEKTVDICGDVYCGESDPEENGTSEEQLYYVEDQTVLVKTETNEVTSRQTLGSSDSNNGAKNVPVKIFNPSDLENTSDILTDISDVKKEKESNCDVFGSQDALEHVDVNDVIIVGEECFRVVTSEDGDLTLWPSKSDVE